MNRKLLILFLGMFLLVGTFSFVSAEKMWNFNNYTLNISNDLYVGGNIYGNISGISNLWNESGSYIYPYNLSKSVGIGTSTPGAKLEINAIGGSTPNFIIKGEGEQTFRLYNTNATGSTRVSWKMADRVDEDWRWIMYTDVAGTGEESFTIRGKTAGNVFYANGGGNVGIGTTSIVTGEKLAISNGTTKLGIFPGYLDSTPNADWVTLDIPGLKNLRVWDNLSVSGNVGIGTTNPQYGRVEIGTDGVSQGLAIYNSTGSTFRIYRDNDVGYITRGGINTAGIAIKANGDVGIGTTTPQNKLNVVGDLNVTGTIYGSLVGNSYWNLSGSYLYPSNTTYDVGIGTTTPGAKLDVAAGSGSTLKVAAPPSGNSAMLIGRVSGSPSIKGISSSDWLIIDAGTTGPVGLNYWSSGNVALAVGGGYVGIGTASPGQKLDVSGGNIRTTGQLISTVATGTAPLSVSSTTLNTNLNADLLDGYNSATASTVNTVAVRDGSGDINARLFRSEYDTTNPTIGYIMTQVDTASNNYIRPSTPAQLKTALGLDAGGTGDIWVEKVGDTMTGPLAFTPTGPSAWIGDTFVANTYQSYINFNAGSGSSDPGFIMHETSGTETNEGVLHLVPSDDNGYGDYVSIHGTNDPDMIKLHTSGDVEGVNTIGISIDAERIDFDAVNNQIEIQGGNVGIGTTAPSYKLHVLGDIYANGGWLRTSGSTGWYSQTYGGGWYMTDTTYLRSYNNKPIYVGAGNSYFGGNVGIGITSPSHKFQISNILTNANTHNIYNDLTQTVTTSETYYNMANYNYAHTSIGSGITNSGYLMGARDTVFHTSLGTLTNEYGHSIQYGTYTGAGTITNAYGLRIDPYYTAGTITNMYDIYLGGESGGGTVYNKWGIYQSNTKNNYFAGNVGIGVSPTVKLDVAGPVKATQVLIDGSSLNTKSGYGLELHSSGDDMYITSGNAIPQMMINSDSPTAGTVPTAYYWYAGSSSTYADHTVGDLIAMDNIQLDSTLEFNEPLSYGVGSLGTPTEYDLQLVAYKNTLENTYDCWWDDVNMLCQQSGTTFYPAPTCDNAAYVNERQIAYQQWHYGTYTKCSIILNELDCNLVQPYKSYTKTYCEGWKVV